MSYLINEKCIKCKFTDCVNVCPVDCFYEGENFLVINPNECIDCAVCVPECPIGAIELSNDDNKLLFELNDNLSKIWNNINKNKKNYFSNKWIKIKNKLHLLKI